MSPALGGDAPAKAEAREVPKPVALALRQRLTVAPYRSDIEIAGARERFGAHQIAHEVGGIGEEALGERRPEHSLWPPGDCARQHARGGATQQIFVLAQSMQLPARMNAR